MKRNTWKKTIAFVMAFTLVAGTMPANVGGFLTGGTAIVAKADYVDGTLVVGGTSVTSTTTSGAGWSFNASTNTLTLNDVNITSSDLASGIAYTGSDTLKIVLVGTNNINLSESTKSSSYGISCSSSLEISGEGALTVKAGSGNFAYGIFADGNLTISGGTVSAEGKDHGISVGGTATFSGGTVTAVGNYCGVFASGSKVGADANVTAKGGNKAFGCNVINVNAGKGWTNVEGTEGEAPIEVNTNGQDLTSYKMVQFLAPVTYMAWNDETNQLEQQTLDDSITPTTVESSTPTAWGTAGEQTWYVVSADTTISNRITVTGTVNLMLKDGATLTASKGINVPEGATLNIYGQSAGTGELNINGVDNYNAGIGGNGGNNGNGENCGTVTINGGKVNVTGGAMGAGIGGGAFDSNNRNSSGGDGGTVTINGGTVNATGGRFGAGIGGGSADASGAGGAGGTVIINGGTVTATGGKDGKAIGKSDVSTDGGTVTIADGLIVKAGSTANPTTDVTSTFASNHDYQYVKIGYPEVTEGSPLVLKEGSKFTVNGVVSKIGETTTTVNSGELFTVTAADNGLSVSAGSSTTPLTFGENSAKTFLVEYNSGTLTFTENKVYSSGTVNIDTMHFGDVAAPGVTLKYNNSYIMFQQDNLSTYQIGEDSSESLIKTTGTGELVTFAVGNNAFYFDHFNNSSWAYFNQTHIDLGPEVATPPTAVTGLTYDGTVHDLLATAGEANENSQMQYSLSNVIELNADTTLNIDNVKVGYVYHLTNSAKITLPNDYKGRLTISAEIDGNEYKYFSETSENRSITDILNRMKDLELTSADSFRVTKVDTQEKKIYFDGVKVADYANCWSTAIPEATNAGDYTVFYKAVRASDSTESVIGSVDVTIEKANPTATTTPTAKTDLKYTGQPQALINAGAATGGTVEYRDTTLIPKESSETLAVNDVKIGNVYKPTGDAKISFPTGYAVSFGDTTITTYIAESNTVYSFKFNGSDTNNPYIEIYKDTEEACKTNFPGDALRILAIDQSSKTIMFEVVNSADAGKWTTTIPQGSYAGDYTVYYRVKGDANHSDVAEEKIENVNIAKGYPLKTDPTAKTGLTNRTTPVQLINAGVPQENCKIEYSLGTQTQSNDAWIENASEITANAKGTFYVWYKVTSNNANYADFTAIEPIKVTVSQYVAPTTSKSNQTWTLTMNSYAYDGTAHEPTINGTTRGTVTYTYYNADTDEELDEAPSAIGNYKVKVYASGNNAYNSKSLIKTYSITDPIDKNGMASVDAFKANGTVPASDGKIFAGWFTDSTCQTAYTEKTGKAYAKFIDEKILTVKAQISSGTTVNSASTSIRFITSVDSLKYQNVGFKITCNGKTIDRKMTKVYTAINAGGAKVKPTVFSEDSRYMEAYTLNNITKDDYGKAFTVTPYYTTQDGTIVEGATNTFTIANMIK